MNAMKSMVTWLMATSVLGATLPTRVPIPHQVEGVMKPVMELSEGWEFRASDDVVYQSIQVPGEWAMQGYTVAKDGVARYRTSVVIPEDWKPHAIYLRFDAVHPSCKVYVNGVMIGEHQGGFVPFEFAITEAVRVGTNELQVEIPVGGIPDHIACMSQYAAHQVGGILRKVRMFCVPKHYLSDLWYETELKSDAAVLKLNRRNLCVDSSGLKVRYRLLDANGQCVAATETTDGSTQLVVSRPNLWTSETPYLYQLEVTCSGAVVKRKVGLREIQLRGNQMWVNGKVVKLLGVNRHEIFPTSGRSIDAELCRKDVELFREANCNLIRTSHYPPSEEFLEACDELGMFVESEAAVCWIEHPASPIWKEWDGADPKYLPYLMQASLDQVVAYRSHPSIVMWSIANESKWTHLFKQVYEEIKKLDGTRPITFHDQCWGDFNNHKNEVDIANFHYPNPTNSGSWSQFSRPVWFGEYVHVQCYNRCELAADPGIRSDWYEPFAEMVNLMWQQPGCLGGAIWSGIDDVFVMPNGDLRGYGHWGVIDAWRRKKPEFYATRQAYAPVKFFNLIPHGDREWLLTVQNRFHFTDLKQLKYRWVSGDERGEFEMSGDPHATIQVPIRANWKKENRLTVSALDAQDRVVSQATYDHPLRSEIEDLKLLGKIELRNEGLHIGEMTIPYPVPLNVELNGSGGMSTPAGTVLSDDIQAYCPEPPPMKAKVERRENGSMKVQYESEDWLAELVLTESQKGFVKVDYQMKAKRVMHPRQAGLVFQLPKGYDQLSWCRKAMGEWSDEEALQRIEGSAQAGNRVKQKTAAIPTEAWNQSPSVLGSADFRATRNRLAWIQLSSSGPVPKLRIRSTQHDLASRAWMNDAGSQLLIAGYHTGGADSFFSPHYSSERKTLQVGDGITGSFYIESE